MSPLVKLPDYITCYMCVCMCACTISHYLISGLYNTLVVHKNID